MGATENAGFNAKVQWIAGMDRLLSYLLAKRQWHVCKNTNHTTSFDHRFRYSGPSLWQADMVITAVSANVHIAHHKQHQESHLINAHSLL